MKAPDKIYLAESKDIRGEIISNFASSIPFKTRDSIAYIRKDALLEWAKAVKADPMIPMNIDKVIEKIESL